MAQAKKPKTEKPVEEEKEVIETVETPVVESATEETTETSIPEEKPVEEKNIKPKAGATVENKNMAGRKIFARTGKIIEFDSKGKTVVADVEDVEYLLKIPGYTLVK